MSVTNVIGIAARELRAQTQARVVVRGDEDYIPTRRIWNEAVQDQPALIVVCKAAADVQAALRIAREYRLPLSVRGGGHDWAGRALRHDGLVIDLSHMKQVSADVDASVATIQGGATAAEVTSAVAPYGLVAATGSCGTVGIVGLTLGGGYGPLMPRYGLASDNLLSAEVVLADGRLVACDERENTELFWALRGGGGNFGVVTSIRVRLHPVREVLAGMICFPISEAESVLRGYAEVIASAPEELSVSPAMVSRPDGSLVIDLAAMWSGESGQGEPWMARLKRLGTPLMEQVSRITYRDWLGMFDSRIQPGRHCAAQSRWLAGFTPENIASLVAGMQQLTSPFSGIILHHFRGAATRVPLGATVFGLRKEHFMLEIVAIWEPSAEDDGVAHQQWARDISQNLAPYALPGGYPNMLGPEEHEQAALGFGDNLSRLQRAKRLFDPENVFSSTISLPLPQTGAEQQNRVHD